MDRGSPGWCYLVAVDGPSVAVEGQMVQTVLQGYQVALSRDT